jgi:uncharacterized repeat protein (TIGR01451 family)
MTTDQTTSRILRTGGLLLSLLAPVILLAVGLTWLRAPLPPVMAAPERPFALVSLARPAANPDGAGQSVAVAAPPSGAPAGVEPGAWEKISRRLEQLIYQVRGQAGRYTAEHPQQGMRFVFDDQGVTVQAEAPAPIAATANAARTALWLGLRRYGSLAAPQPVGRARVTASGQRVEYHYPTLGLTEWYENGPRGLEQGFTLAQPPAGGSLLKLEIGLRQPAHLSPRLVEDGAAVEWVTAQGKPLVRYGSLAAYDARGHRLPASLGLAPDGTLGILVQTGGAVYPVTIDPLISTYLKKLSESGTTFFGNTLAADGDLLAISAPYTVIGGGSANGSVYLFARNQGGVDNWGLVKTLTLNPGTSDETFGIGLALSGDLLAVGVPDKVINTTKAGAVYLFGKDQGGADNWGLAKTITDTTGQTDGRFGVAVALENTLLVVGAPWKTYNATQHVGEVKLFSRDLGGADNWGEIKTLVPASYNEMSHFGETLALAGDTLAVGLPGQTIGGQDWQGQVDLFDRNQDGADVWGKVASLTGGDGGMGDQFGVSLSLEGDLLAVGASLHRVESVNGAGAIYLFGRDQGGAGLWGQVKELTDPTPRQNGKLGAAVLLRDPFLVAGGIGDFMQNEWGLVYVFGRNEGGTDNWGLGKRFSETLSNAADSFGYALALNGSTLFASAPGYGDFGDPAGAVFVYDLQSGKLALTKQVTPTQDVPYHGAVTYTVALSNSLADPQTGVRFTDTLPAQVDFVDWVEKPAGTQIDQDQITWTGDLAAGEAITFAFQARHTGATVGSITNTAQVSSTLGQDSQQAVFSVLDEPVSGLAAAASSPDTLGQITYLTATTTAGTHISFAWDFGDGQTGSGITSTHSYSQAGVYTAVVTATNTAGSLSVTTPVTITNLPPVADAGPGQQVLAGASVSLDGRGSYDPEGHLPLSYSWRQTNGDPVTLSDPSAAQPTFTATASASDLAFGLVVSDSFGLRSTLEATVLITVTDIPVSGLSGRNNSPKVVGTSTLFTGTVSGGTGMNFYWDFGDGHTCGGCKETSHIYTYHGTYTATLSAINQTGWYTATTPVTITNNPPVAVASFTPATVYVGNQVNLVSSDSSDPDGHLPLTIKWTQTGGTPVTLWTFNYPNIYFYSPSAPGVLTFTLMVTDYYGMGAITPAQVVIPVVDRAPYSMNASNNSPTYADETTSFNVTAAGTNLVYTWNFGDEQTGSGYQPTHIYASAGSYTAVVTATNSAGSASKTTNVTVLPNPVELVKPVIAADGVAQALFGTSVATNGDLLFVGAPYQDAVYVFDRLQDGSDAWGLVKKVTVSGTYNNTFGQTLAASGDILVVGAPQAKVGSNFMQGAVYVFARNQDGADNWGLVKQISQFFGTTNVGYGNALALEGETLAVGVPYVDASGAFRRGLVQLYARSQGGSDNWGFVKQVDGAEGVANANFGMALALSDSRLFVGAPNDRVDGNTQGTVSIFGRDQGGAESWGLVKKFYANSTAFNNNFGTALSASGGLLAVGAPSGADGVYLFAQDQGGTQNWGQIKRLPFASGEVNFGNTLVLHGERLVAGALTSAGATNLFYVFDRNWGGDNNWGTVKRRTNTGSAALAFDGSLIAAGAPNLTVGSNPNQGAVYLYRLQTPALSTVKQVTPILDVPYHGTVTYTVMVSNTGLAADPAVVLTDSLPAHVAFTGWVDKPAGADESAGVVTWSGALAAGERLTLRFTASHTGDPSEVVANTAWVSDTFAKGSHTASFTVIDQAIDGLAAENSSPSLVGTPTLFTATVTAGSQIAYTWDFGDGSQGSGLTPTHTYTRRGSFTAVVTATNRANQLSVTTPVTINNQPPVPDAGPDQTVYINTSVNLDGSGSSDPEGHLPLSYGWQQTGGTPVTLSGSTSVTPSFTAPGVPAVLTFTLMVTDSYGTPAPLPDEVVITVTDIPISGLAADNSSPTTLDHATLFTATLSAGSHVSYAWDFGDGGQGSGLSPSHIYAQTGTYTAVVTATNSLGQISASTQVTITNLAPVADPGPNRDEYIDTPVTLDGSASYDPDGHLPLAYLWTQTGGTPVTLSGARTVSATFTSPATNGALYFTLVVSDSHGLGSTPAPLTVNVGEVPIGGLAAHSSSPTTLGHTTFFTATITQGSKVTYAWDFGDGDKGSGAQPTHVYTATGSYTAWVTATNSLGETGSSTPVVVTNLRPVVDAGPDQDVQVNSAVSLDGRGSYDPDGHLPLAYFWKQTGGTPVTLNSASVVTPGFTAPANPAVLTFTLAITDSRGLAALAPGQVVVRVHDIPISGLVEQTSSPTTLGHTTYFSASQTAGSNIVYTWGFGDGQTGSGANPTHAYDAAGSYTAILTATNAAGSVSLSRTVVVTNLRPLATAGAHQRILINTPAMLDGTGSDDPDGHTPLTYLWKQTGGAAVSLSGATNVTATFTTPPVPAVLTFTLMVTDSRGLGALAAAQTVVEVGDTAIQGLGLNAPATPFGLSAYLTATLQSGTNISYAWSFGDGLTGSSLTPGVSHLYLAPGVYPVVVTATNSLGASKAQTMLHVVRRLAGLQASNSSPTRLGSLIWLSASVADGGEVSYRWNFGDGTPTVSGPYVLHLYSAAGNYTALVTATNPVSSLSASTLVQVRTNQPPLANAGANRSEVANSLVTLDGRLSSDPDDDLPLTYHWEQTGGPWVSLYRPYASTCDFVAPATPADLTFSLVVTDARGLGSAAPAQVTIHLAASATRISGLSGAANSPVSLGQTSQFTATVTAGTGVTYRWNFGDGSYSSYVAGSTVQHTYAQAGSYTVIVTASNNLNSAAASIPVTILDTPVSGLQILSDAPNLLGQYTTLRASALGSRVVYRWNPGDGSPLLTGNPIMHRYPAAGSYTATVTATNSLGSQSATYPVLIITPLDKPSAVTLDRNVIDEHLPAGSRVGRLGAVDHVSETITYTLVAGAGSSDNSLFAIAGDLLLSQEELDYRQNALHHIRVRATNRAGRFAESTLTVRVLNVNEAPTLIELTSASVSEEQPVWTTIGTLSAQDPDPGDSHTFNLVPGPGGDDNLSFGLVGNLLKTRAMFHVALRSQYHIRLRVTDLGGLYLEQTFTITILPANRAPTALALSPTTVQEGLSAGTLVGQFSAQDPNPTEVFSYSLVDGPGLFDNAAFRVQGTQLLTRLVFDYKVKNRYVLWAKVTDQGGLSYARALTVTVGKVNYPPVPLPDLEVTNPGSPVAVPVLQNDYDPDRTPLRLVSVSQPSAGSVELNGNKALSLDGVDDYASLSNADLGSMQGPFMLEAWVYPTELDNTPCQNPILSKDTPGNNNGFTLCVNASGWKFYHNDKVSAVSYADPSLRPNTWHHVAVAYERSGDTLLFVDGTYRGWEPYGLARENSAPLLLGASTRFGRNFKGLIDDVRIWDLTRNQLYLATFMGSEITGLEQGLRAYYKFDRGSLTTAYNEQGDATRHLTLVNGPTYTTAGWLGQNILYTPPDGFKGTATFTYTVSNGYTLTAAAGVTVHVLNAGSGITAQYDYLDTMDREGWLLNPLRNDKGDELSLAFIGTPLLGPARIVNNRVLYTPTAYVHDVDWIFPAKSCAYQFCDRLLYGVRDRAGNLAVSTISLGWSAVIPAPGLKDLYAAGPEDTSFQVNVLEARTDVKTLLDKRWDRVLVSADLQTQAGGRVTVDSATQLLTYTPKPGFWGRDQFTYYLHPSGLWRYYGGFVYVDVVPRRRPPQAVGDNYTFNRGSSMVLPVMANDTPFLPGDTLHLATFGLPQNGTLEQRLSGELVYTPYPFYVGEDHFSYIIQDQAGLQSTGVVTLTIQQVDTPPIALPAVQFTAPGVPTVIDVGANAYNPSGKPMTVDRYGQPANGQVSWIGGTQFLYTPTVGYQGEVNFTYTLRLKSPCEGKTVQAICTTLRARLEDITPQAANARPAKGSLVIGSVANPGVSAANGASQASEGSPLTINPLSGASSSRGQNLAIIGLQRRQGLLNLNDDGSLEYTSPSGFSGVEVLTYTVSDGNGGVAVAYITMTVNAAPRPPLARTDFPSVVGNTPTRIDVLANDTNRLGGPLTVTSVTQPLHGLVQINADNTVTYTPTQYYAGSDSFSYGVINTQGLNSLGMVFVTVTRVNFPPVARDDQLPATADQTTNLPVLLNDSDPNGDALHIVTAQAAHGSLRISPLESLLYAPLPGFTGSDQISYTISDGDGGRAGAWVSVQVSYALPRLFAMDDVYTATLGQPFKLLPLENDWSESGQSLRLEGFGRPTYSLVSSGILKSDPLVYTPTILANDTFSYTVSDGLSQATAWVKLNVLSNTRLIYMPVLNVGKGGGR